MSGTQGQRGAHHLFNYSAQSKLNASVRYSAILLLLASGVSGCSGGSDDIHLVSADTVCGGSLSVGAQAALSTLTHETQYEQDIPDFTPDSAAKELTSPPKQPNRKNSCAVFPKSIANKASTPEVEVTFSWSSTYNNSAPNPPTNSRESSAKWTYYPIGIDALAGDNLSSLDFRCALSGQSGIHGAALNGEISYPSAPEESSSLRRASAMTILLSVSQDISRKIGCKGNTNLPATLPNPDPPAGHDG